MTTQRKQYSADFKARVALAALKGHKTVNELASTYSVHPTQIAKWKKHLQSELPHIFSTRRQKREQDHEALQAQLYQQIGQLKVALDWLKKIWTARLTQNDASSSRRIRTSALPDSVSCWGYQGRAITTPQREKVLQTCT